MDISFFRYFDLFEDAHTLITAWKPKFRSINYINVQTLEIFVRSKEMPMVILVADFMFQFCSIAKENPYRFCLSPVILIAIIIDDSLFIWHLFWNTEKSPQNPNLHMWSKLIYIWCCWFYLDLLVQRNILISHAAHESWTMMQNDARPWIISNNATQPSNWKRKKNK